VIATDDCFPKLRSRPAVALLLAATLLLAACTGESGGKGGFRTAKVDRGTVQVSISATGTLRALSTVDVGSQVSGQVLSVDVDYNDRVVKGQVIARIDPANFQTRLTQTEADLASAKAGLVEAQSALKLADAELKRKRDVAARKLISVSELEIAQAGRDQAAARVGSAQAAVKQRAAGVADAALDVEYAVIRSPVDGVILLRSVEPGQTVAASFQTPVLFRIAEDLTRMQIDLSIDESDVGQIREGLPVSFNVDAYPNRNFEGKVYQVRLSATNVANVVTYPVVVEVSNPDLSLLPGMTANADIEIASRADVLRVPNAALRFKPEGIEAPGAGSMGAGGAGMGEELTRIAATLELRPEQQAALELVQTAMRERAAARRQGSGGAGASGPNTGGAPSAEAIAAMRERFQRMFKESLAPFRETLDADQRALWDRAIEQLQNARRVNVWLLKDGKPSPLTIRAGVSDGTHTEILGGGIEVDAEVIVGAGGGA
jgi:HlyD family secretion protein